MTKLSQKNNLPKKDKYDKHPEIRNKEEGKSYNDRSVKKRKKK